MTIRLSNAQVTRIEEALNRYERNGVESRNSFFIPHKLRVEELVEDILKEVLPCPINTPQTPNEQPNASDS
jgi:hypothetical protein